MTTTQRKAFLVVRSGTKESELFDDHKRGVKSAYVRDRRGIVQVWRGPDGQDCGERVVARASKNKPARTLSKRNGSRKKK